MTALLACLCLCVAILRCEGLPFAVIGDWGMGGRKAGWQREMRSAMMLNEVCEQLQCNFTISTGDNIYVGDVMAGLRDSFEAMFTSPGPFFPCIGNHDNWGPQVDYTKRSKRWKFFGRYYTVTLPIDDTGYTVQLFGVDGADGGLVNGGQFTWLENELKMSTARWKFIFGHYPTVGGGRHRRLGSVSRIHSIMEQYNVQAYFCGHDHILEVSNVGGRILATSGAMARGGMMWRGLGSRWRRFSLTNPNEYNQDKQDWPSYGFITGDLSPNVLALSFWDHYGGMQYELVVPHDWIRRAGGTPEAQRDEWPPESVILEAYKAELSLPKGPGGGTAYDRDGNVWVPAVKPTPAPTTTTTAAPTTTKYVASNSTPTAPPNGTKTTPNSGATAAPTNAGPTTTTTTKVVTTTTTTPAPVVVETPHVNLLTDAPVEKQSAIEHARYAVNTECQECTGPTCHIPFTVFIHGVVVDASTRLYLTTSVLGCDRPDKPFFLSGTQVIQPHKNVVSVASPGPSADVYVCFSLDNGQNYRRLRRVDDYLGQESFLLDLPLNVTRTTPPPTLSQVERQALHAFTTTSAPTSSSGGSTWVIIAIAVGSMVCGAFGAIVVAKIQLKNPNSGTLGRASK